MSLYANESCNLSTGELEQLEDSVLIAYDDLRIVNSKLVELKYQKSINTHLKNIIYNDSIIIKDYTYLNDRINNDCKKAIKQRNICFGVAIGTIITSIIFIFK